MSDKPDQALPTISGVALSLILLALVIIANLQQGQINDLQKRISYLENKPEDRIQPTQLLPISTQVRPTWFP